jgi:hypothetical protein
MHTYHEMYLVAEFVTSSLELVFRTEANAGALSVTKRREVHA